MTGSTRSPNLGRHVFGAAVVVSGLVTLVWHDYKALDLDLCAAVAQIYGGAALQFRRTAKTGALFLTAVYLILALLRIPQIVTAPQIYNSWGDFFEQFSLLTGAAMIYGHLSPAWPRQTLNRVGRVAFGICVASFTLEQAIYLDNTAELVPKWLPPGQMFWAIATTVPFALAAVALLTNWMALLATRLLTLMLVLFGVVVWVPLLFSNARSHSNWSETAETFAIAGAAWILADLLATLP